VLDASTAAESNATIKKVCQRGVSLPFLQRFVRENSIATDEPSWKVRDRVVKPATENNKCSYFSMLAAGKDREGYSWAGEQSVFVSHCWSDSFCSLVETITEFERIQRKSKSRMTKRIYYYIGKWPDECYQVR
jgi:hypothetical protein